MTNDLLLQVDLGTIVCDGQTETSAAPGVLQPEHMLQSQVLDYNSTADKDSVTQRDEQCDGGTKYNSYINTVDVVV